MVALQLKARNILRDFGEEAFVSWTQQSFSFFDYAEMYLLLALLLLQAIGATAGRVTTSIELSGAVQTPNNRINEVVFVLPTLLPKEEGMWEDCLSPKS